MPPEAVLLSTIQSIVRIAQMPVSVDLEDGYSDSPAKVAERVLRVAELGVVGINLEDGSAGRRDSPAETLHRRTI